jgi:5S rRNA maturation endonuclease (ribonuclease M5)
VNNISPPPQIEKILNRLQNVKQDSNGWKACCPSHEDKNPSLSIALGKKGGVLLKCFAGCTLERILDAIELTVDDVRAPKAEDTSKKKEFKLVPPGKYIARVHSAHEEKVNYGEGEELTWKIRYLVQKGINQGDSVFERLKFQEERSLQKVKSLFQSLGIPTKGEVEISPGMIYGHSCIIEVGITKDEEHEYNRVLGYEPVPMITYDYFDENRTLLYQVVRFIPKDFTQRRTDGNGGWLWNLDDTRRVPYHYPEILNVPNAGRIFVVEGEKDSNNLMALGTNFVSTTGSQGAKGWTKIDSTCLEAFRDKHIYIIPDDDAPGYAYASTVAESITTIAATIHVIKLLVPTAKAFQKTNAKPIKDISDWIDSGGTVEELENLVASAPTYTEWFRTHATGRLAVPGGAGGPVPGGRLTITNYEIEEQDTRDGVKKIYKRIELFDVVRSIRCIFNGWPKRLGNDLFIDHEGDCYFVQDEADLFAYFHKYADIQWSEKTDDEDRRYITRKEIYSALRRESEGASDFIEYPLFPLPESVYVSSKFRIETDTDGSCLNELLGKFNPVSAADEALLGALSLTPFWGGEPGGRPMFVITGPEGIGAQESGKTTLAELVGMVAGGVFRLRVDRIGDSLSKQILSEGGMRSRVMLLDNMTGPFDSTELADLITASYIEGRPAYGRQRRRVNRLTWVMTSVSPELDEDLASRSVVIHIAPPNRGANPGFKEEMTNFIRKNRSRLISDAISTLRGSRIKVDGEISRFPAWDREVLACHDGALEAVVARKSFQESISSRNDDLANFAAHVLTKHASEFSLDLSPQELCEAWNQATGKKLSVSWVSRMLRLFLRSGKLFKAITPKFTKRHGSPWVVNIAELRREIEGEPSDSP